MINLFIFTMGDILNYFERTSKPSAYKTEVASAAWVKNERRQISKQPEKQKVRIISWLMN